MSSDLIWLTRVERMEIAERNANERPVFNYSNRPHANNKQLRKMNLNYWKRQLRGDRAV